MNKTTPIMTVIGLTLRRGRSSLQATPRRPGQFPELFREALPECPEGRLRQRRLCAGPRRAGELGGDRGVPPYETAVANGETLWKTPFANGKTYADCFPDGPAMAGKYPYWDKEKVIGHHPDHGTQRLPRGQRREGLRIPQGPHGGLDAYVAFESRGQVIDVKVPDDDPRALEAFEKGKEFYFTRRGQFNFSCAHCHMGNSGTTLRTEILSPAFGHTTHWPVYRSKWGEIGTLHRRYEGCNKQVRAASFEPQGDEYRNLEYFMTYMDNGLTRNGPGARK